MCHIVSLIDTRFNMIVILHSTASLLLSFLIVTLKVIRPTYIYLYVIL